MAKLNQDSLIKILILGRIPPIGIMPNGHEGGLSEVPGRDLLCLIPSIADVLPGSFLEREFP